MRQGQAQQQQQQGLKEEDGDGDGIGEKQRQEKTDPLSLLDWGATSNSAVAQHLPRAPPGLMADKPRDQFGNVLPPGTTPLPPGALDGFDPNVLLDPTTGQLVYRTDTQKKATKLQPKTGVPGMLNIYTDGSSLRNGSKIASAGVGVYFGSGDNRYNPLTPIPTPNTYIQHPNTPHAAETSPSP